MSGKNRPHLKNCVMGRLGLLRLLFFAAVLARAGTVPDGDVMFDAVRPIGTGDVQAEAVPVIEGQIEKVRAPSPLTCAAVHCDCRHEGPTRFSLSCTKGTRPRPSIFSDARSDRTRGWHQHSPRSQRASGKPGRWRLEASALDPPPHPRPPPPHPRPPPAHPPPPSLPPPFEREEIRRVKLS